MTDITYLRQLRQTISGEFYFGAMCHETKQRIAISPDAKSGEAEIFSVGRDDSILSSLSKRAPV